MLHAKVSEICEDWLCDLYKQRKLHILHPIFISIFMHPFKG